MESFIRQVVGNDFNISLKKLFFKRQSVAQEKIEERAFFCSELVTKAFKETGLLQTQLASSNFFPADFASQGRIQLVGEARFGDEMVIQFEEDKIESERQEFLETIEAQKKREL